MFSITLILIVILICSIYYSYKYRNNIYKFIISVILYGFALLLLLVPGFIINVFSSSLIVKEETSEIYSCLNPDTWCHYEISQNASTEEKQEYYRIKNSYNYMRAFRIYAYLYPYFMLLSITAIKNKKYRYSTVIVLTLILIGLYATWALMLL